MNKKIINRQSSTKKNLKGFLYLFMVFVGPQVNSMKKKLMDMSVVKVILAYEDKLKDINQSQISKPILLSMLQAIETQSLPSNLSSDDKKKIKNIEQEIKKIIYNLDKNWPLSFYKFNLVEGEVTDMGDTNKKIKSSEVVRKSFNWKVTLLGGTMFFISTFGIYTFFLKHFS